LAHPLVTLLLYLLTATNGINRPGEVRLLAGERIVLDIKCTVEAVITVPIVSKSINCFLNLEENSFKLKYFGH